MAIVTSYNIKNITGVVGNISIDQVSLPQDTTVGIAYLSPAVVAAQSAGLISVEATLSPEDLIANLTAFINSLHSLPPIVTALPAGTVYVEPEPEV